MAGRFSIQTVWTAKDRITTPVTKMQNRIGKFTRSVEKNLRSADRAASKFLGTLGKTFKKGFKAASVGAVGVAGAVGLVTREFMKLEDAQASFQPMLGSAEKAKDMIAELNKFAADTPFQLNDLTAAAGRLFPMIGNNMPKMMETIKMLGDLSGGSGERLQGIATAFSRMMMKGRTEMMELNMLNDRNVPIFKELQKVLGVNARQFFKLSAAGRITSDSVMKAFKNMTSAGGMFFGATEIASMTTRGRLNRLLENFSMTAAKIGEVVNPTVREFIELATNATEKVRNWLEVTENRQLVIKHFTEFVEGAKNAVKALYDQIKNRGEAFQALDKFKKVMGIIGDGIIWLGEHGATVAKVTGGFVALAVAIKAVSLIMAGIAAVAAAPTAVLVAGFTAVLGVLAKIASKSEAVMNAYRKVKDTVGDFIFGDPDGPTQTSKRGRMSFSPQDRAAKAMSEIKSMEKTEVTIKDETGRAEVTKGGNSSGFNLAVAGAF